MNRLENRVNAYNVIVKEINKQIPKVLEIVKEFENKKVITINGVPTMAFKVVLGDVLVRGNLLTKPYLKVGYKTVYVCFRITYKVTECGCNYIDIDVPIIDTDNQILSKIWEYQPYKTTTLEAVLKAEKQALKAQEEYNNKISKIKTKIPHLLQINIPKLSF